MGLIATAYDQHRSSARGTRCTVGLVLEKLKESDRQDLLRLLADEGTTNTSIERTMADPAVRKAYPGLPRLSANTVGRHRGRSCLCPA